MTGFILATAIIATFACSVIAVTAWAERALDRPAPDATLPEVGERSW